MQKSIYFLLFCILLSPGLTAQDTKDSVKRNEIKLNLVASQFRNISLYYEHLLNENWSLQLGAAYKIGGQIPKFVGLGELVISSPTGGVAGYSFTPEVRYYFRNFSEPVGQGLYLGGYTRYTYFFGEVLFQYWDGNEYLDLEAAGNLSEFGLGLQLGYKVVLKEKWVIDLMFMGPRASLNWVGMELESEFAEEVIPKIEAEINKRLEGLGMEPISLPTEAGAHTRFNMINFRFALAIGYRF